MTTDPMPSTEAWPRWVHADGPAMLAAYTSGGPAAALGLLRRDSYGRLAGDGTDGDARPGRAAVARAIAGELFAALAEQSIPYNLEADAWADADGQVMRDLHSMTQTSGTCLDFALAYASMCKLSNLRPLVGLIDGMHAVVLVDLANDVSAEVGPTGRHALLNPGLRGYQVAASARFPDAEAGATQIIDGAADGWRRGGDWVAVDIVAASRGFSYSAGEAASFESACTAGWDYLAAAKSGYIIDICDAHRAGVPEFQVPVNRDRLALHTNLPPERGDFRSFASRSALIAEARNSGGQTVVLLGRSGTGKSWLARHVARGVAQDCGWWVDATGPASLTAGLAAGEAAEAGRDPAKVVERLDVAADAERARLRLRTAEGPWVVVLDNADGEPRKLGALPAPRTEHQMVIITTTNEEWRKVPGLHILEVPLLPDRELRTLLNEDIPEAALRVIDGRPLVAAAVARLSEQNGGIPWSTFPGMDGEVSETAAPAVIWTAARDFLGAASDAAAVARAMALLPPVQVSVEALAGLFPHAADSLRQLADVGLIDVVEGAGPVRAVQSALMHRLFRRAVLDRGPGPHTEWVTLASRLVRDARSREVFAGAFDPQTSQTLHELIADPMRPKDERAADLHLLGRAVERHDPVLAEKYLLEMLLDLGWAPDDPVTDLAADRRLLAVDALRTKARPLYQEVADKTPLEALRQIDQALELLRQALELCTLHELEAGRSGWTDEVAREWLLAKARTEAMRGIAFRTKAGRVKGNDRQRARELQHEAEVLLHRSLQDRKKLADGESRHDVDRAEFNLAGLHASQAQLDDPSKAREHLDASEEYYTAVYKRRLERYGTEEFEDVITCVNGFAIVDYYRAVLLDLSRAEQLASLRRSMNAALRAAEVRARLWDLKIGSAPGTEGPDALKSLRLTWKALSARMDLGHLSLEGPAADFLGEWMGLPPRSWWILDTDESAAVIAAPEDAAPEFKALPVLRNSPELPADIRAWATSDPLNRLVQSFGRPAENLTEFLAGADTDLPGYLARLDTFTDRWDTRNGRERNLAGELPMTTAQIKLVLAAARALGFRDPRLPSREEYDYVFLLGGLVRACLVRPEYAARLITGRRIRAGAVVALGARRALGGDEPQVAQEAGLAIPTAGEFGEFDVLDWGTRRAFGLGEPAHVHREDSATPFGGSEIRTYQGKDGLRIIVGSAPSREPETRRANTGDGYAWFAEHVAHLEPGQKVLAITTDIYRPAQHASALTQLALPYGVDVETVGHVPARVEAELRQSFSPTKYLLEIRSTIRALRLLVAALGD